MSVYMVSATALPYWLGVCKSCVRPIRIHDEHRTGDHVTYTCPECGNAVSLERLYGTVNAMECDPRCMGAAGPSCSCSCGGVNHGGAWQETGEILADALARYRAEQERKAAERERKASIARKRRDDAFALWRKDHESTVAELLGTDWLFDKYPNGFLAELADMLYAHEALTDRQMEAAERILAKRHAAAQRQASRKLNAVAIPEGRHEVTGTIVHIFRVQDNYSYYGGDIIKMVVDCGTYSVSGTAPTALLLGIREREIAAKREYDCDHSPKGYRIKFRATLKPGDELGKGRFSRPTNVEILGHE